MMDNSTIICHEHLNAFIVFNAAKMRILMHKHLFIFVIESIKYIYAEMDVFICDWLICIRCNT